MAGQLYERSRSERPDEDPDAAFRDRGVKLATTFGGAGVLHGDLTAECAAIVDQVLDALGGSRERRRPVPRGAVSRRAGRGDAAASGRQLAAGAGRAAGEGVGAHLAGGPAAA